MKWPLIPVVVLAIAGALAGCQAEMKQVVTLDRVDGSQPYDQMVAAPEKGTYYLYSSKKPNEAVYHTDLKRGEQLGFHVSGDRAQAIAKGIRIELSDYSEGANYVWKREEKKE
jgi:hypothetical protein